MNELGSIELHTIQEYKDVDLDNLYLEAVKNNKQSQILKQFTPKYSKDQIDKKKKGVIAKFFSNMSRFGMAYEDDVVANMRALPADKDLLPSKDKLFSQDLFNSMSSAWKVKSNKDKNFFEKDFAQKRDILRKLAIQPELEDILDTMCNECVVYDSNYTFFCEPYIDELLIHNLKKDFKNKLKEDIGNNFMRFYKLLGWKNRAWDDFKRFLIEGILSWEIVYDSLEKPTKIIGFVPVDPVTLTRKLENNKWYWYQFKGIAGKERKLLDAQIIYIEYQDTNVINRISYLERLIRPFNIYRIIEQAQIIWTVTQSSYKLKFTIPVSGMNKAMASQTIASAMQKYKEDIKFDSDSGELSVNGQMNLPFNKEYWMGSSESGEPSIETMTNDGPELNDNDQLKYFKNQLYKMSKIPLSRFDQESGETWFGAEASSVARVEIDFGRFVTRLRNIFSQIMIKPLQIQLMLDNPEIEDDKSILEVVQLKYNSYNVFEELLEQDLMQKRVEFIQNMKDALVDMDEQGNDVKYFSNKYLVKKYLKWSDDEIRENEKWKQEEAEEMRAVESDLETP